MSKDKKVKGIKKSKKAKSLKGGNRHQPGAETRSAKERQLDDLRERHEAGLIG